MLKLLLPPQCGCGSTSIATTRHNFGDAVKHTVVKSKIDATNVNINVKTSIGTTVWLWHHFNCHHTSQLWRRGENFQSARPPTSQQSTAAADKDIIYKIFLF